MLYRNFIRPLLFLCDPEAAHDLGSSLLRLGEPVLSLFKQHLTYHSPRLESHIAGIRFSGPVGLAAGFDKTGRLYPSLSQLGFNFIECGTFTAHKQKGNPVPRLFRLPEQRALINRMGFNNPGAEEASLTFSKQSHALPRGINIGKSKTTPLEESAEDYVHSLKKLSPFADYITINISSPNTPRLRRLQEIPFLRQLLDAIQNELTNSPQTDSGPGATPHLFIKVAPDLSLNELDAILKILIEARVEGIIVSNTSLDQSMIPPALRQTGGLSGSPLKDKSTALIRHCFRQAGDKLIIIGVGGIDSGETALEKIFAGASLIQIYTGYVYQGPGLPAAINRYIDRFLQKEGLSLKKIVGMKAKENISL